MTTTPSTPNSQRPTLNVQSSALKVESSIRSSSPSAPSASSAVNSAPAVSPRFPLARARAYADKIAAELSPFCHRLEIAGSIRRGREFCGDVDLVVMVQDKAGFRSRLLQKTFPLTDGDQNLIVKCVGLDLQIDVFFARAAYTELFDTIPSNWGTLLLCRTGSVAHNIFLVERAKQLGLIWNPYRGVIRGNQIIAAETEEQIFKALKLDFIPPEKRER